MVPRPGRITRFFLARLLHSVDFASRLIDSLRDAEERGSIVYVMRTRSLIDYAYFNLAFLQHGLKLVRFANGVRTWMLRGVFRAFGALARGRRGLPSDLDCLAATVHGDMPAMLFLRQPRGREVEQIGYSLPHLERLVQLQRRLDRPIYIVPTLLIWDKRPERAQPTLLDDVFGTRQSPTFIKKLTYVIQNFWQSFLHLGRPTVQLSSSIDLQHFIAGRPELGDLKIAQELRANLNDALKREERVVVGPWVKRANEIRREILNDPRVRNRLAEHQIDINDIRVQKQARKIITEIAADFSPLAIKSLGAILHPVWNTMYDGIEVDYAGLDRVRDVARDQRIVIVPSHKSHVDYLVISYVFYHNGLIPPHIAAGVNLSFWPLGPIFRRAGAFFLRRSFAGDPLYQTLFSSYLVKLLEEGFPIEFFIEGTRSRTGKLAPPRYGMLNMIVEAYRAGNVDKLALVPVSVGYEKVIESDSYRKELEGSEKKSESLGGLLKTPQVLASRYGRVYVEFGEAISLGDYLAAYHEDTADIERDDLERSVRRLAYRIIHGINDVTTVTPSAIAALVLLNSVTPATDIERLVREAGFVLGYLRERHVRLSRTITEAVAARIATIQTQCLPPVQPEEFNEFDRAFIEAEHPETTASDTVDHQLGEAIRAALIEALSLLADNKLTESEDVEGERFIKVPADRRVELAFYKNNILHYFADDAVFATAIAAACDDDGAIDLDTAREHARFLSRLLKYEFCFNERRHFDAVFDAALQTFVDFGWLTFTPGSGAVAFPGERRPAGFEFVRGLLLPIVESYHVAARCLDQATEWVDARALTRRAVTLGRTAHLRGEVGFPESRARSTLESCFRIFREWHVLEARDRGRGGREVRLNPTYPEADLKQLVATLGSFVHNQKRHPIDALDRLPRQRDDEHALPAMAEQA